MTLRELFTTHGLAAFVDPFERQHVALEDLADISDDDLARDFGLRGYGDRKRYRAMVAALGGTAAPAPLAGGETRVGPSVPAGGATRVDAPVVDAGATRVDPADALPRQLGSYKVLGLVGAGGMGVVVRARHLEEGWAAQQGGDVAIKLIAAQIAQAPEFRARFLAEAALGRKVQHPGLVPTWDVIAEGPWLGTVMSFVEGETLATRVRAGGAPLDEVLGLLGPVGETLDHLHASGIVHRDIKPANIVVRPDGRPVILDLGIAKDTGAGGESHTRTMTTMGTSAWMAPEQADAKHVDGAADRYAFGLMAYALLSGRMPWGEGTSEVRVLSNKLVGQLEPLGSVAPAVPAHVSAAVMRMLAVDPAARFGSCAAFVGELRRDVAAEARAAEAEARAKVEAEARAKVEREAEARAKAEREAAEAAARAKAQAERVRTEAAARAKAEAEAASEQQTSPGRAALARAKAERETKARAERETAEATMRAAPAPTKVVPPASGGSKLPLLVLGVVAIVGGGWWALRPPEPSQLSLSMTEVMVASTEPVPAPEVMVLDADGVSLAGYEVDCVTPEGITLSDDSLRATKSGTFEVACRLRNDASLHANYVVTVVLPEVSAEAETTRPHARNSANALNLPAGVGPVASALSAESTVAPAPPVPTTAASIVPTVTKTPVEIGVRIEGPSSVDATSGSEADVTSAIRRNSARIKACADAAAKTNPNINGIIGAAWQVSGGKVFAVKITVNETGDHGLEPCVLKSVASFRFDSTVDATVNDFQWRVAPK